MEILEISCADKPLLESILEEYEKQEIKDLSLFKILYDTVTTGHDPEDFILIARDGFIKGFAHYKSVHPKNKTELNVLLRKTLDVEFLDGKLNNLDLTTLPGFRNYKFSRPLLNPILMQCYPRRIGGGRTLLDFLKRKDAEGIFLESLKDAIEFYEKCGFKEIGLYPIKSRLPLMIWMKSGEY